MKLHLLTQSSSRSTRRDFVQSSAVWAAGMVGSPAVLAAINNAAQGGTPRRALVIGNGKYPNSPLDNPAKDAKAIGVSLAGLGFGVKTLIDVGLADLTLGIQSYLDQLAKEKAVGLFYYAGHGAQLAWRNFLLPVDADIRRIEDMPKQAFELNQLLSGLAKASNPMNIIVLDACRNNPFGQSVLVEQKGLSQFDAPPSSILAYATSPGNTASDGTGDNGLFTEYLLREMVKPEAKIEDVFKRVRLNVRLQSKGQQIPWESTSLEDDFYFVAQGAKTKESQDELAVKLGIQKELWEAASSSTDAGLCEAYLKQFPGGIYSELAQARLDKLLALKGEAKIQTVSSSINPFSKGSADGSGKYAVGDSFTFAEVEPVSKVKLRTYTETVTAVDAFATTFDGGQKVIDLLGNQIKSPIPRFLSPAQFYPATYRVGQKWKTSFGWARGNGSPSEMDLEFTVIERQTLKTSAGTFNAFLVRGRGSVKGGYAWTVTYAIDPEKCSVPLIFEMIGKGVQYDSATHRLELVAFQQRGLAS